MRKKVYFELTVGHVERDSNLTIKHDYPLEAQQDYNLFRKSGFKVILRKVTETVTTKRSERQLKADW